MNRNRYPNFGYSETFCAANNEVSRNIHRYCNDSISIAKFVNNKCAFKNLSRSFLTLKRMLRWDLRTNLRDSSSICYRFDYLVGKSKNHVPFASPTLFTLHVVELNSPSLFIVSFHSNSSVCLNWLHLCLPLSVILTWSLSICIRFCGNR